MTALVGQDVKRKFSRVVANSTGLGGESTLKALGQDFGHFNKMAARGWRLTDSRGGTSELDLGALWSSRHNRKLDQN